ncbi:hypothetical protein B0H19DRAFT_962042, partial [Mycena capillaripes]
CSSSLKHGKTPSLALANYNYLGQVPLELQELAVTEETMIARCRAKCWIIQLKEENDYSIPVTTRSARSCNCVPAETVCHFAKVLPLSIDEVITPVCVLFVASHPPTSEWLRKKEKPLTVPKENVLKALAWLKTQLRAPFDSVTKR